MSLWGDLVMNFWLFVKKMANVPWFYLVLFLCLSIFSCCEKGRISRCNYARIKNGMTLSQVEGILGPGREIDRESVPQMVNYSETDPSKRSKPVVNGDVF